MWIRQHLAQDALCLGLTSFGGHSLSELPLVQDLRERDIRAWDHCISQISESMRENVRSEDLAQKSWDQIEYEVALLFRELRRQTDDKLKPRPLLPWRSSTLSPQESLLLYCAAFGFRNSSTAPFGTCDISAVQEELSKAAIFVRDRDLPGANVNLTDRVIRLGRSLPFGMLGDHWQPELKNRLSLRDLYKLAEFQ